MITTRPIAMLAASAMIGTPFAVGAADYNIRLATITQVGQPIHQGVEQFKEIVEKNTDGQVAVEIYPGGQLGGEIEIQDSVANGTLEMGLIGSPLTSGKLPKLDVLNMYYLWEDRDHLDAVLSGPIGEELFAEYEDASGIHVVAANWQQGVRKTLIDKPATTPEEMDGTKIRVTAGVPIYDQLWDAMGASPIPLPFPDAYSAMQTGVVDGVELPLDFIVRNGFHEVGTHLVETDHYIYANFLVVNDDYWQELPEDLRTVIDDAGQQAGAFQTELVVEQDQELLQEIDEAGVEVVEADIEAFREAVQPVIEDNMNIWGQDLWDEIQAAAE